MAALAKGQGDDFGVASEERIASVEGEVEDGLYIVNTSWSTS